MSSWEFLKRNVGQYGIGSGWTNVFPFYRPLYLSNTILKRYLNIIPYFPCISNMKGSICFIFFEFLSVKNKIKRCSSDDSIMFLYLYYLSCFLFSCVKDNVGVI